MSVRVAEVDWVHTSLLNAAANSQDDVRVAFGISFRLRKAK
jgi:hypothetical protein